MGPDLGGLAVLRVDDMDEIEPQPLTRPLGADRGEHHRVVIADQDIVRCAR